MEPLFPQKKLKKQEKIAVIYESTGTILKRGNSKIFYR